MMKAIVLLSGGLDSSTTAYVARSQGFELHALSFDYGQTHRRELDSARRVSAALCAASHEEVKLTLPSLYSALLGGAPIPDARPDQGGIPDTYVPGRNLIFLSVGASYAESLGAAAIFAGMNAVDYSGYPDCRPEFLALVQAIFNVGTRAGVEGHPLLLRTPLLSLTKKQIVLKGQELGLDFSLTWSCYRGGEKACGRCDSCRLRLKGFREAGLKDPLPYERRA